MISMFDEIEIKNTNRIAVDDKEFCDDIQSVFTKCFDRLLKWRELFIKAQQDSPSNGYENPSGWHVDQKYYGSDSSLEEQFSVFDFTPLYPIERIDKLIYNASCRFENKIVEYFNSKYHCRFESQLRVCDSIFEYRYGDSRTNYMRYNGKQPLAYGAIIDYIVDALGGTSFIEQANMIAIDEFRQTIRWGDVTLKGNKISFTNWGSFHSWSGYRIDYEQQRKIRKVLRVLALFESGHLTDMIMVGMNAIERNNENVNWGSEYLLTTKKVVGIKFFKNNKMEIKFADASSAEEFFKAYELSEVNK